MKIIIDLNAPEFQTQIQNQVEALIGPIVAEKMEAIIQNIVETKCSRLTDKDIDKRLGEEVTRLIKDQALRADYWTRSRFETTLREILKEELEKNPVKIGISR